MYQGKDFGVGTLKYISVLKITILQKISANLLIFTIVLQNNSLHT